MPREPSISLSRPTYKLSSLPEQHCQPKEPDWASGPNMRHAQTCERCLTMFGMESVTLEYGSELRLVLAWARDSAAVSMTARDLGISAFILVSWELEMVSRPTLQHAGCRYYR